MKILITGGTGFVGTQLITRLIQDGHVVTILTRSLKGAKGTSPEFSIWRGIRPARAHGRHRLKTMML